MQNMDKSLGERKTYMVWDRTIRWFHWINVLCVICLVGLGLSILNEKLFGVSADGKILLKEFHSYVGYLFAVNLAWRMLWGFLGNAHTRWKAILPFGTGYSNTLRGYIRSLLAGKPPGYLGHNPLGRLMVSLLFLLLLTQAVTGLVLAGTDLYQPPFGGAIAEWVTKGNPEMLANLKPGSKQYVNPAAYDEMRSFRSPIITTHLYTFYLLMVSILLHIVAVVVSEVRERNGLISAMFSGEKVFSETPVDTPANTPKRNEE
jgi:Ni/Fe-hydrogenase 1 B-type cytochrome subunit